MNKKIKLNDIKIEWLNKKALVLISIFSTAAYKQERVVIDLRASNVLDQVSKIAKESGNEELASLYQRIKREVRISLREVKFEDDESSMQIEQAMEIKLVSPAEEKAKSSETKSSLKDSMFIDRAYPL